MSLKRLVFIKDADLVAGGRLRPKVLPALLDLRKAGFGLVLSPSMPPLLATDFEQLLMSQGVAWTVTLGKGEYDRRPHISGLQDWLPGDAMDRSRSVVIGQGPVDAAFAANLGVALQALSEGPDAWSTMAADLIRLPRRASVKRQTTETSIAIEVDLDGEAGAGSIATGIGFFDHMLSQLARHGGMRLDIKVNGDLHIDEHHTVEDTALALGQALRAALGDRFGIERYAFVLPMDETLVQVALDLSGRPHLAFVASFSRTEVGGLPTELVPHFFRSLCEALGATLHIEAHGDNAHHIVEGIFKGVARCFREAVRQTSGGGVPSTKGVL